MTSRRLSPRQRVGEGIVWCEGKRHAIARKLGYRGLALLMFGLIFIIIGISVIGANDYRPDLPHTHLPHWFRIGLWCVPGVMALITAWDGKWQVLGFTLMFIPPGERAVSFAVAVFAGGGGWERVPGMLLYLLITLTLMLFAAWPEPAEVTAPGVRSRSEKDLTDRQRQQRDRDGTT